MKVIVIGGGPAGLMAAGTAGKNGNEVILIEKMPTIGRKLLITGKGRCNITNNCDISEFVENIPGNGNFLYSALYSYTNQDVIDFFEKYGVKTKVERGQRVFPVSDKSNDVLTALKKYVSDNNVKIYTDEKVNEILTQDNKVVGIRTSKRKLFCDKLIIATGGKSYKITGSTGDGYKLLENIGHSIVSPKGSLIPLETYEIYDMQGLSLKNIGIKILDIKNNKKIYTDFGEMLFTHFGVSGPIILSSSAHLLRYKDIENKLKEKEIKLYIDLKPALDKEKLTKRIERDFLEVRNKMFKNSLDELLPKKMIPVIIDLSEINPEKKVCDISKKEIEKLVELLKNFELSIKKFRPIDEAIITAGGVNIKEINPSTMESKIIKDLYIAGELIDVDAYTGGFNLQIAFSTGYLAGMLE